MKSTTRRIRRTNLASIIPRKKALSNSQLPLRILQLALQSLDIINGQLNRTSLTSRLTSGLLLLLFGAPHAGSSSLFGVLDIGEFLRDEGFDFLEGVVDAITTALFGEFVVCAFGAEIFG